MYAVIVSGSKQYRVREGQSIEVDRLDQNPGTSVEFGNVLAVSDGSSIKVGAPYVEGSSVRAEVVDHGRGAKIHIIKFRRRKHHMKRQGFRPDYTKLKITQIIA